MSLAGSILTQYDEQQFLANFGAAMEALGGRKHLVSDIRSWLSLGQVLPRETAILLFDTTEEEFGRAEDLLRTRPDLDDEAIAEILLEPSGPGWRLRN